jgi:diacylglycerol O-acyltransferase
VSAGHSMSSADAAWLHMDRGTNPMVVNAVFLFDEPLDWKCASATFERRIVDEFPRFRQRVAEGVLGGPRFEDHPEFDPDEHFHRLALPAPGDQAALQELVGDLITSPLDDSRPLWHVHLIDGYGDGCAMLVRIHHCVADGIALARVMMLLTDQEAESGIEPASPPSVHTRGPLGSLLGPASGALSLTRRAGGAIAHEWMESLVQPGHLRELAGRGARDAATLVKLLVPSSDTATELKDSLHGSRRVAWSTPFPLERVKAAAHRADATVNDILVTALTGALRRYLGERHDLPTELHAMVPFNLRPLDQPVPRELGNDFGLIILALPVGIEDPRLRLREVQARMADIKTSDEGPISYGILSGVGMAPARLQSRLIDFFTGKASMVVTNVPGPSVPVYMAGAPVRGVLVWAPCSGTLGMTVSIFSYAGDVTVGFMTDRGVVPSPEPLVRAFEAELRTLCRGTRRSRKGVSHYTTT